MKILLWTPTIHNRVNYKLKTFVYKTFTVAHKSVKTAKVFYLINFMVYVQYICTATSYAILIAARNDSNLSVHYLEWIIVNIPQCMLI